MYLFIATILIAELIITTAIVMCILNIDKRVLALNNRVSCFKPEFQLKLKNIRSNVEKMVPFSDNLRVYVDLQKEKIIISVMQDVLIFLLLVLLKSKMKGNKKKYLSTVQLALALKDFWQNM